MTIDAENLKRQIPYYLTAEDRRVLVDELKAIASGQKVSYILGSFHDNFIDTMLQGDGWRGFQVFSFETGERRSVRGLVLSNSCDIDPDNPRDLPTRIIFVPLVKLSTYQSMLDKSSISIARIKEKIHAIKAQQTTNLFFLPAGGSLKEDYLIRFDEAQSMPRKAHQKCDEREKLFTLSNTGFYMLVFKLSIHFCRLQENISRSD